MGTLPSSEPRLTSLTGIFIRPKKLVQQPLDDDGPTATINL